MRKKVRRAEGRRMKASSSVTSENRMLGALGVTVSTEWDVGAPWTSGGFLTEQVYVPLSFRVALMREMEPSPRAGLPCHFIRPLNCPSVGGKAREEKWKKVCGGPPVWGL